MPFVFIGRRGAALVAGLVAAVVVPCQAAETADAVDGWPRFRGPQGDGVVRAAAAAEQIPLTWSTDQNVRWRTEIPGQGWSSPVVVDGQVYLSAAIPVGQGEDQDYDLTLLILDAASGRIENRVSLIEQRAATAPAIHLKNSHASPTPIVAGDRVYVHFGHQGTACTTRAGDLVWVNRELAFPPAHGNGGSPILVDDRLIFTCDGGDDPYVAALDARDGSVAWRTPRPVQASKTFSFCTPTLIEAAGRRQVIAPGSDCVLSLDPLTGRVLWQVHYDGFSVIPKPIFVDGLVIVATGFGRTKLLAIRPDGQGNVTDSHVVWQVDKGIPKTPSLIASDGRLFLVSDDGIGMCLDAQTGQVHWRERLGGNFSASPVLIGDRLHFTNEAGVTTVIRASERFEQLAENDLGERTLASPAIAHGALFVRTADALYRIE